jgi:ATP-dependent exoDNAse (exonuclease V) alpha subunit
VVDFARKAALQVMLARAADERALAEVHPQRGVEIIELADEDSGDNAEPAVHAAPKCTITLNERQAAAVAMAKRAAESHTCMVVRLAGCAGTGKSSALLAIADAFYDGRLLVVAPTGRAALRVRQLTGLDARTIHSWLYIAKNNKQTGALTFHRRPIGTGSTQDVEPPPHGLLIVDESSMVNRRVYDDLMLTVNALACSVLFVGDGYQLPPVQDRNEPPFSIFAPDFMCDESVELTEVFRQALESPILRVATAMRTEGWHAALDRIRRELKGTRGSISADAAAARRANEDLIVIVHRNETRFTLNRKIRERFGVPGYAGPAQWEPLLVRKNDYGVGVFNGEILPFEGWSSEPDPESGGAIGITKLKGVNCLMSAATIATGAPVPRKEVARLTRQLQIPYVEANLGHCVTCHSSQGSEWDDAIVAIENSLHVMPEAERSRWAYTAITRAKREVRISFL